jgi:hypothetical protein
MNTGRASFGSATAQRGSARRRMTPATRLDGRAHVDAYAVRRPSVDGVVTGWFDGNKEKSDDALWDLTASSSSAARRPATAQVSKAASMDGAREGKESRHEGLTTHTKHQPRCGRAKIRALAMATKSLMFQG